jgi:periplasmic divalent cation tolerance protein
LPESDVRVAWSTAPDRETALRIARPMVEERLAACVNIVPDLVSVYRWRDELEEAAEVLLIIKTRADRVEACRARLRELHPYDVPEFLVLPVAGGAPDYLRWVAEESAP